MSLKKMKKEDLELLSNKDITCLILEESKKPINTANLFKKIIEVLELPDSVFENKIAEYYTSLSTDKRFIMLKDGTWDLRTRHTSDKVVKVPEEDDEDDESAEDEEDKEENESEIEEDNFDDAEHDDYDEDASEELKDLVILDEDELELEQ